MVSDNKKHKEAVRAWEKYKIDKKQIIEKENKPPYITRAKLWFPLTKQLLRLITALQGEKIFVLNRVDIKKFKDRPIIYANTHRFKPDFEKITIVSKEPSVVIASDFINSYKTINGWYFKTRPTIWVDPYSKEDRNSTFILMKKYLNSGMNCMIFPEAVWNLSPNKLVLDTFLGTVKAAIETDAIIIVSSIERYGKKYIINQKELDLRNTGKAVANISDECINGKQKKSFLLECNQILRNTMATALWEIWEFYAAKNGFEHRADVASDYWNKFVADLVSEWKGYKIQDNIEQQYHNKKEIEQAEAFAFMDKLIPSQANAFLLRK